MESPTGTSPRADGLRPLGLPRRIDVRVDTFAEPGEVRRARQWLAVAAVEDAWRVAAEWWRNDPVERTYYRVLLADGRVLTLFHDDAEGPAGGWYEQSY